MCFYRAQLPWVPRETEKENALKVILVLQTSGCQVWNKEKSRAFMSAVLVTPTLKLLNSEKII